MTQLGAMGDGGGNYATVQETTWELAKRLAQPLDKGGITLDLVWSMRVRL